MLQQNNRPYLQLFTLVILIAALIFIPAILDHFLVRLWPSLEDFTPLPLLGAYCVVFLIAYQLMPYIEPTPKQKIARLTRRLEQSPTDRHLLQQRAQAYLKQMMFKGHADTRMEALHDAQQLVAHHPTYYDGHQLLIQCYYWAGQHQQALEANATAFALQPITASTLDDYYSNLYDIYCDQHQEEALLPIFKVGLETYQTHEVVVLHWLAILYDYLDNTESAKRYYQRYQAAGGKLTAEERRFLRES